MSNRDKNLINSVDRALRILDLFSEKETELKLTEISRYTGLHKSTVHGLLRTLVHHQYITQNPENGKYRLGLKIVERGNLVLQSLDIRKIAYPYLKEIADKYGDSTHLVILEADEAVYIDKVEGDKSIFMYSKIGRRAPLYCTAVGKTLIADKDKEKIAQLAEKQSYKKFTEHTIINKKDFIREIDDVKKQGYAVDNEELELGLRCIAVPIYNYKEEIVASISISGPINRVSKENEKEIVDFLKEKVRQISLQLGYGTI